MPFDDMLFLALIGAACLSGGLLLARFWRHREDERLVRQRLTVILKDSPVDEVGHLLEATDSADWVEEHEAAFPFLRNAARLIDRSGVEMTVSQFIFLSAVLLAVPPLLAFAVDPSFILIGAAVGVVLSAVPWLVAYLLAEKRRNKFIDQLPDGIELMISVLRGGLSVPQAVKSVGEEIPAPCGPEFGEILQRMNLGQSLPDSIQSAVDRYEVFELDLIRRAAAIQLEVGGSLADLLEKTNSTLRERLKLKRKIGIHTAQSRLSGYIIAALPFFVAIAFQIINPAYLQPLYTTNVGRVLVILSVLFQIVGVIVIQKLASFRV